MSWKNINIQLIKGVFWAPTGIVRPYLDDF